MTITIQQKWFEMEDLRRRKFANSVWIPLRASETTVGEDGREEVFALGSVAFPPSNRERAEKLRWSDLGLIHSGGPYAFHEHPYKPAEIYQQNDGEDLGIDFIFDQRIGNGYQSIWHINQDIVLALALIKEGDSWLRPEEDYIEVIRERRSHEGRVIAIEIRSEFLRDYLAARRLALRIAYYRQRIATVEDTSHVNWPNGELSEEKASDRFCARIFEVDSSGGPFGGGVAVFHYWRTDVDADEDVPTFGPETDSNTAGSSTTYIRKGKIAFRIEGELWREEWIEPATRSERVRGDKSTETFSYVVDASGNRKSNLELNHEDIGCYLWFDPRVIKALEGRRGGGLLWYTSETGSVWCSTDWATHFGINSHDVINVYAYDIAKLPVWQLRIWAGFNTSPEGGVSAELLQSQQNARPAKTCAAEKLLPEALLKLDEAFLSWKGFLLLSEHKAVPDILRSANRFRALEQDGILALAKDLARLIVDRINIGHLRTIVAPPKGEDWGSLKSLEKVLASIIPATEARAMLSHLVGIYELRLGDAHLPSTKLEASFALAGLNANDNPLRVAEKLIDITVRSLTEISDTIIKYRK